MTHIGKTFAAALLLAAFGMQSGAAQAQCAPGTPACAPAPTQSGGGGGGVGVQVDVGDAAKAIGGLFKKKKKPVVQPTEVATAPVEQPKQEIIYVRNPPVMQELPRTTTPRKTTAVARPKPQPVVRKPAARKIAAPVVAAAAVAEPMFEPEVAAELPLPEPAPVAEVVIPVAPVATIAPVEEPAAPANNLYWIIAAAIAALVAAGTAAKFFLTPKVAMDCNIADGTSRMVSDPNLSKPEVSFDVVIPGFAASTPDNFRILA
jgi:hypothetical protein